LSKFLLRRHCIYRQTRHDWGTRHWVWLESLRFDDPMNQATFDSYLLAVQQLEERQRQLDTQLAEFGAREPYREPVAWRPACWPSPIGPRSDSMRAAGAWTARARPRPRIIVAMARELTDSLWAVLHPAAAATRV
jgi:hypothetical protein